MKIRKHHIVINLLLTSSIMSALWYTGPAIEGIKFKIKLILSAPSFFIVLLTRGPNNAMHFTSEIIFDVISFIFYSGLIGAAQLLVYVRSKKKELS